MSIYFHLREYEGRSLEIMARPSSANITIMWGGKPVASMQPHQSQELIQYLVNHGRVNLTKLAEGKATRDKSLCVCQDTNGRGCSIHFEPDECTGGAMSNGHVPSIPVGTISASADADVVRLSPDEPR